MIAAVMFAVALLASLAAVAGRLETGATVFIFMMGCGFTLAYVYFRELYDTDFKNTRRNIPSNRGSRMRSIATIVVLLVLFVFIHSCNRSFHP